MGITRELTSGVVRVLIADDQALFRRGLFVVLDGEEGIEVVGEAENGADAIARAEATLPDVVLMDIRMPLLDGIEATRQIRKNLPGTKVLILTVSDDEEDMYQAIEAGASGYLLKEISVDQVAEAIHAVVQGQSLISPTMASKLLTEFTVLSRKAKDLDPSTDPELTRREVQVLRLVAKGMTNRDVGEALCISENTVKNHVRNILEKLHLHSRVEAVMYAVRKHLLDPHAVDQADSVERSGDSSAALRREHRG